MGQAHAEIDEDGNMALRIARTDAGSTANKPHFNIDQLHMLQAELHELQNYLPGLRLEVQQLETRAAHLRTQLADGDAQRRATTITEQAVPMVDIRGRDAAAYFAQLEMRERELNAKETELMQQRTECEKLAATLHDERSVLAEQTALLLQARRERFQSEVSLVDELEQLASQLVAREAEQANADAVRLEKARALWTLHNQLEARQTKVTLHEQALHAATTHFQHDCSVQQRLLDQREQALATIGTEWSALRREELRRNRERVEAWEAEATKHRLALGELETLQTGITRDAAEVAAEAWALDQLRVSLDPSSHKKLDRMKANWERKLLDVQRELDRRRAGLDELAATAESKLRALGTADQEQAEREAQVSAEKQTEPQERATRMLTIEAKLVEVEAELRAGAVAKEQAAHLQAELTKLTAMLESLPPPTLYEAPLGETLVPLMLAK